MERDGERGGERQTEAERERGGIKALAEAEIGLAGALSQVTRDLRENNFYLEIGLAGALSQVTRGKNPFIAYALARDKR